MRRDILEKIDELERKQYHLAGDVYVVLGELKKYIKEYEIISNNTN